MEENFLNLMDAGLENTKEPMVAEDGEYTLEIADWKVNKEGNVKRFDANGNPFIMPLMRIVDNENSEFLKDFTHYLPLLHTKMNAKERNTCGHNLKEFFQCFGIDFTQTIDYEDTIGLKGDALLVTSADEGYGEQNRIKKLIAPR